LSNDFVRLSVAQAVDRQFALNVSHAERNETKLLSPYSFIAIENNTQLNET
jgi:hypothetical protein